jgi:hypothetical protein
MGNPKRNRPSRLHPIERVLRGVPNANLLALRGRTFEVTGGWSRAAAEAPKAALWAVRLTERLEMTGIVKTELGSLYHGHETKPK